MIVYPCAKINIGLKVIGKRPDGYHDLETFFFPVGMTDILEVVEAEETTLSVYGNELDCKMEDNLCFKAYNLLKNDFDLPPVEIHLLKRIPSGAGLGGGSSDASNMLIALNKLFSLQLDNETLCVYASKLGSDCPFFIHASSLDFKKGEGMYGEGKGEILTPLTITDLAGITVKIEVPDIFVSTAEAYAGVSPLKGPETLKETLCRPLDEWKSCVKNDFEDHIFKKHPLLALKKQEFYKKGAIYASMSGSGSAVYGLFRD